MDRDTTGDLLQSLFVLSATVEARDPHTGGHLWRVSQYGRLLGERIGLPPAALGVVAVGGFLHDLGKIAVPDAILLKPGKLTPDERKIMERHVEVGYGLLRPLRTFADSLPAVRFHHERLDGSGYPLGIKGDQVPVTAQIMAIVDVYDALTTDRVYRPAMNKTEAFRILREEAGRGLHDPKLVESFVDLITNGAEVAKSPLEP